MKRIVRLERWLCLSGMAVAGFFLVVLVLLSGINVFGRMAENCMSSIYIAQLSFSMQR